ncbi:MAG TPA: type I-C CRISPR-associated protein Cas7/Csd2 [Methanoregulaceae archaeon]|nr:type I-C CRISPR-associated protein Cas7/Csd2 [Methanoregulaceae archaeon]
MSEPIKNRYEFVLLFDVENGNPNGDPDMGNMPRIDPQTGHGIVTDVCLKRKIRNYTGMVREGQGGFGIYVTEGAVLNTQHRLPYEANPKIPVAGPKDKVDPAITKWMADHFYDIRTFGAVMTTGVNCGQIRGPVQLAFARSIDPIFQNEITVTRCAVTKEGETKDREMGKKQVVPYALYRADGYVSANLARKSTGFSEDDLDLLWEALVNMFEHDHSAARGKMSARKLLVFKHDSELGCYQAHLLFDRVKVTRRSHDARAPGLPARSFEDYEVTIDRVMPGGVELIERL